MIERRDQSENGKLRRLQEKNMFNCQICHPKLCNCSDKNEHGIRFDGKKTLTPLLSEEV